MKLKLTNKQRVLNTFAKKKIDRVVFSPNGETENNSNLN